MINYVFVSFALAAGVAAFFAPCSAVLLPGYITYYISRDSSASQYILLRALRFAFLTTLGFFTVFGIAGSLVLLLGHRVKMFIPFIAITTGVLLIFVGFFMLLGKKFYWSISLPKSGNRPHSAYFFGIAYAVASLGCTFSLFVTVLLQGIINTSLLSGFASLAAYIMGLSVVLLGTIIAATVAQECVRRNMKAIIPYVYKASALILILAGTYMIYYQTLL